MAEKPEREPFMYEPFMYRLYRLDPAVQITTRRLERRGPREFFIVGKTRDGYAVENKLSGGATFVMRSI